MAQGLIGVNGTPRNISEIHVGVGGTRRACTEAYVGVDGKPRLMWAGNKWANKVYTPAYIPAENRYVVAQVDKSTLALTSLRDMPARHHHFGGAKKYIVAQYDWPDDSTRVSYVKLDPDTYAQTYTYPVGVNTGGAENYPTLWREGFFWQIYNSSGMSLSKRDEITMSIIKRAFTSPTTNLVGCNKDNIYLIKWIAHPVFAFCKLDDVTFAVGSVTQLWQSSVNANWNASDCTNDTVFTETNKELEKYNLQTGALILRRASNTGSIVTVSTSSYNLFVMKS
ncbi:MAG: hypothetical protein RSD74_00970 [Angelakisella sp.]